MSFYVKLKTDKEMKSIRQYYEEELAVIRGRLGFYTEWGYSPELEPLVKALEGAEEAIVRAMPKTIIITDVAFRDGRKHARFSVKDDGKSIAYVKRNRDGKYEVWAGWPFLDEIGSRARKDAAIDLAKKSVLNIYPNAEFKLNAVSERVR